MKTKSLFVMLLLTLSFNTFAKENVKVKVNLKEKINVNRIFVLNTIIVNCFEVATTTANAYQSTLKKFDVTIQPCEYTEVFNAAYENCNNRNMSPKN